ncbi:MAG: peptidyl-prolyl cis-trans isomerase [Planctomycetota bacterium]
MKYIYISAALVFVHWSAASTLQNEIIQDAPAPASRAAESTHKQNPVLLEIAGQQFTAADAFEAVMFHYRDSGLEILRKLAGDAVIHAEAARLGVSVDLTDIEPGVHESVEELRKRVDTEFGASLTFDQFLESEMRMSLSEYKQLAAKSVEQKQLAAFTIRYEQIRSDRVAVRHLIVRDKKTADACLQKLRDGADFAALARSESIAPSKTEGGKLPPLDRELEHPIVKLAFETGPGSVGGPVEEILGPAGGKGGPLEDKNVQKIYHLFRVLERLPARNVTFAQAKAEIVNSIRENPIRRFEFEAFMRKVGKRYPAVLLGRELDPSAPVPPLRAEAQPADRR